VGVVGFTIVDSVGAEELKLGWLNMAFSGRCGDERPESMSLGDSMPEDSNAIVGRKDEDGLGVECCEECEGRLERPSI
jgi:hypothetical protein